MNIRWKLRIAAAQREEWAGSQLRRLLAEKGHEALGMCSACWQSRPNRLLTAGAGPAARLASPPDWLAGGCRSHFPAAACQ